MKLLGYDLLIQFSTALILILLYSGVLWHTFRGSKFPFVYKLVTLLILTNVSQIAIVIEERMLTSRQLTLMYAVVLSLLSGLTGLTECVSYLLLAFKYRRIAKELPYAIEERQLPEAEKRCDEVLYKVLLILSIIFPTLSATF